MIPILYPANETTFTSNGLGRLIDASTCEVTEERNGSYELVMTYPVDGQLYDQLLPGNYIGATHDDNEDVQPFQIYRISAPIKGLITVNAWHISYALNSIVVEPYAATTCAGALAGILTNSMNTNPFTFWTDKSVTANFSLNIPASARSILGGMQGSILDVYGSGEYEFDKYAVKLHTNRGSNNGVTIRYGKNLRSLDYQLDASNQFNAVVPYWTDEENYVYLDHAVVRTGETADRLVALDMSAEFENQPTTAQLEAAAQTYVDASVNYKVKDNIVLDFVPVWMSEEYRNVAPFERVGLCDTVTIFYEKYNINAQAKVIKTVYDVLRERFSLLELGEPRTSLSQQITTDVSGSVMQQVPNTVKRMIQGDLTVNSLTSNSGIHALKTLYADYENTGIARANAIALTTTTASGKFSRTSLIQFSVDSSTGEMLNKYEQYRFPEVTQNMAANAIYDLVTSKNTRIMYGSITNGGTTKYTISPNSRHFVLIIGSGVTNNYGVFLFACTSASVATQRQIAKGSGVTVSTSGTTITMTSTGAACTVMDWAISGDNLEVTT